MFCCNLCENAYALESSLKRHMLQKHSETCEPIEKKLQCSECEKKYNSQNGLKAHEKKVHNKCCETSNEQHVKCSECSLKCSSLKDLCCHVGNAHNIEIKKESLDFVSFEEFEAWKEKIESDTNSAFVKHKSDRKYSTGKVSYFYCNRSGYHKSESNNIRDLKKKGSSKINAFCCAHMKLKMPNDGKLSVEFVQTHTGHDLELGHLRLLQSERDMLAEKIARKIPNKEIIKEIRRDVINEIKQNPASSIKRIHLVTSKGLDNIRLSYGLDSDVKKHKDDVISIKAWIYELKQSGYKIAYKPQGSTMEEFPMLEDQDFFLAIMDESQVDMLKKFGHEIVSIDGTHGTNGYDFELFTLMVLDEMRQGYPCAFSLSNRSDCSALSAFFNFVKQQCGDIKPRVFMSDMAENMYNAWTMIFSSAEKQLYCSWHVDKAWRNNLKKIPRPEKKVLTYKLLRTLLEERREEVFQALMEQTLLFFKRDADLFEFGKYFERNYASNCKSWAYCYRMNAGINTNMHLERMHRSLKYYYLNGKNNKRVDKAISALYDFIEDKKFETIIQQHKGKWTKKLADLRARHELSMSLVDSDVIEYAEKSWIVPSSTVDDMYVVEVGNYDCKCNYKCKVCNFCIHNFICSCPDSAIKTNMCKHIHLVCRTINANSEVQDPLPPPVSSTEDVPNHPEDGELIQDWVPPTTSTDKGQFDAGLKKFREDLDNIFNSVTNVTELKVAQRIIKSVKPTLEALKESPNNLKIKNSFKEGKIAKQRLYSTKKTREHSKSTIQKPTHSEKREIYMRLHS